MRAAVELQGQGLLRGRKQSPKGSLVEAEPSLAHRGIQKCLCPLASTQVFFYI